MKTEEKMWDSQGYMVVASDAIFKTVEYKKALDIYDGENKCTLYRITPVGNIPIKNK